METPTQNAEPGIKAGIKSSEFITTAITAVGAATMVINGQLPPEAGAGVAAVVVAVYVLARAALKIAHAMGRLRDIADLPALKKPD